MAIVIDSIHLINTIRKEEIENLVILKVTEFEIKEASDQGLELSKDQSKEQYQKYHKDIRQYMVRYHRIREEKNG